MRTFDWSVVKYFTAISFAWTNIFRTLTEMYGINFKAHSIISCTNIYIHGLREVKNVMFL